MTDCLLCGGKGKICINDRHITCSACEGTGVALGRKIAGAVMNLGQMELESRPCGSPLPHLSISTDGNTIWPKSDCIVLVSGGMDSVTLAYYVKKVLKRKPVIMFVDYGQKTMREEWYSAIKCSNDLLCPLIVVRYNNFGKYVNSSLLRGQPDDDDKTTVPGRNLMLVGLAVPIAQSNGLDSVFIAVQSGDEVVYPDCSTVFWELIRNAVSSGYGVKIQTPFITRSKKSIVAQGIELDVDYKGTYSCYYKEPPCGECPSCKLRSKAIDD